MGAIRTLLALSVVCAHTYGFVFVGGRLAVQLFYIISGFLMSYVLTEAKSYNSIADFYFNRALRLLPLYWIVAGATLLMWLVAYGSTKEVAFVQVYKEIDIVGFASLVLANIFVFGQDWIMFTGVRDGDFQLVSNFRDSEIAVWNGLLVPQAWTLGVELTFYAVAPFILVSRKVIISTLCLSLIVRAYLIKIGLGLSDPWSYRFFPTELTFFLLGALSHQILKPMYESALSRKINIVSRGVTGFVFIYCFSFFAIPHVALNTFILIFVFSLSLPFLFTFQAQSKLDARIGSLSYPIYISHHMLIFPVDEILKRVAGGADSSLVKAFLVSILTICLSYVLERVVSERVELLRRKVKRTSRARNRLETGSRSPPLSAESGSVEATTTKGALEIDNAI